jgi:hypothetical protein
MVASYRSGYLGDPWLNSPESLSLRASNITYMSMHNLGHTLLSDVAFRKPDCAQTSDSLKPGESPNRPAMVFSVSFDLVASGRRFELDARAKGLHREA